MGLFKLLEARQPYALDKKGQSDPSHCKGQVMVDSIGTLNRAISVLRSRLAAGAATTRAGKGKGAAVQSQRSDGPEAAFHLTTIVTRLATIQSHEPQRSKMVLRLFVEAVLLDEFGAQYVLAADFQLMVDKVASAIESEPELGLCLEAAVGELTSAMESPG